MIYIDKICRHWLPLSVVSASLYLALGQVVSAKESQGSLPVHGRQITITQSPTINGSGVVADPITVPSFPNTFDADNDALVGWSYQWLYNGSPVQQGTLNTAQSVPQYVPTPAQAGGSVRLSLQAKSDPNRSFPVATQTSPSILSNAITVQAGTLKFYADANGYITQNINENVRDDRQSYVILNTSAKPAVQWTFGGPDRALFTTTALPDPLWYQIRLDAKNYEIPIDANKDNVYELQITATNPDTKATSTVVWRVTVNNVVETASSARIVDGNGVNITSNPVAGQTLHTAVTLDDGLGELRDRTDVTYQWKRFDSRNVTAPIIIPGATQPTYTLTSEDQGYQFRVTVTAK